MNQRLVRQFDRGRACVSIAIKREQAIASVDIDDSVHHLRIAHELRQFGAAAERDQYLDRIAELERLVGRLTLELEVAKKALQLWNSGLNRNGS